MTNYLINIKNKEILIVVLVYLVFSLISLISFKDFGVSIDEWELRIHGFVNLKYVMTNLFSLSTVELDRILQIPILDSYYGTHGAYFATFISFIEYFFNVQDEQKVYFISHLINHLVFILANFYFFLIIKDRYNNHIYGLLGALFLFLSPRIYGESFYNRKDIFFLSIFIINLYYGIAFLKVTSIKNSILFSLTTALCIDIRIMGIVLTPIILFFTYLKNLKIKKTKILIPYLLFLILGPIITILFWPFLWANPINNFLEVFHTMSNFHWGGYNLYFGEYILASHLPWHYTFVWIGITTPIFYLFLFLIGFFLISLRIKRRIFNIKDKSEDNDIWSGDNELQDLINYLIFAVPIFLVISLNSTLYDGWRHLYFIYPSFLYISLKGLYLINISFFKKSSWIVLSLTIPFLLHIGYQMVKDHPHQNVYFNFFAGNNTHLKFEVDYWGLSNKQAFEILLSEDNKKTILIGAAGPLSLENSKKIIDINDRNRLVITTNDKADYIVDNYRNWYGDNKEKRYKIPSNFKIYKEISKRGRKIISIYKKT